MPRVKLERLVSSDSSTSRKQSPRKGPAKEATIVDDLGAAIDGPSNHPVIQPVRQLKKLAGTPFWIDMETGLAYLDPAILKSMKNN